MALEKSPLITIQNCDVQMSGVSVIKNFSWQLFSGESWLVIGPNGGGKEAFLSALSVQNDGGAKTGTGGNNSGRFVPNSNSNFNDEPGLFSNPFAHSTEVVSLERAARLIEEERQNDESEYIEGGVDIGRTGRVFITEGIIGKFKKNGTEPDDAKQGLPPQALALDREPTIKLCGLQNILDRGLKYMSTGEIRRTLLARALLSGKKLLILSDPFAGLDVQSRTILLEFISTISAKSSSGLAKQGDAKQDSINSKPVIILCMERWHEIPDSITNVLEFSDKTVSFCGTRAEYEDVLKDRSLENQKSDEKTLADFSEQLSQALSQNSVSTEVASQYSAPTIQNNAVQNAAATPLVEMYNINVGWGDHKVLRNLTWVLNKGEHWLIRGPNGSGKTTFLELITGDNKQVYANDVRIFGRRRGTGESIWDIKKQLGIVSYRMHVEYRMLSGSSLTEVVISGFRDSIGLYGQAPSDLELASAKKWLKLGGFEGRERESFGSLSYGEQRAVLILRSAVKTPAILILDEPCHGLDEDFRQKVLHLMQKIAQTGTTTMLHVTHDPSEVQSFEKHILELCPDQEPMFKIIENIIEN